MLILLDHLLAAVHLLSGAAWFGALVYRTFFVDPKAMRFFHEGTEFERYSLDLAHGMRYVVMLALVTCGLSGFVLLGLRWNSSQGWLAFMGIKSGLWIIAFGLFGYISWVFWPKRVFATRTELPRLHRQGFLLAFTMIVIAATGMMLGQLAKSTACLVWIDGWLLAAWPG
ncbi:hypothetical protein [Zavarzinella formosa]|uniref:hypothetical protein n=1 Tax=Zavarzinella formosa TaxID=360055 RepID=UPI000360858C|nr:hypothetical protein [Zavarzinella formosa]